MSRYIPPGSVSSVTPFSGRGRTVVGNRNLFASSALAAAGGIGSMVVKRLVAAGKRRSRVSYKKRKGSKVANVGTSYQRDITNVYRKRRMPRSRRRRWVKALRRNVALQMPQQATRCFTMNDSFGILFNGGTGTSAPQGYDWLALKSWNGSFGFRDIRRIVSNWDGQDLSGEMRKFVIGSAVIDFTGRYDCPSESAVSMELDIYCFECVGDIPTVYSTPSVEYEAVKGDIEGGAELVNRGVTPFQLPAFGSAAHRMRILFKKRYQLSSGQAFTYQYRDARNTYVNAAELQDSDVTDFRTNYRTRGTKVFLFIGKPIGNVNSDYTPVLNVGCTRTYTCKEIPSSLASASSEVLNS